MQEFDVDEDRQPTKTFPRTIPEEGGPMPLHRDTTIYVWRECAPARRRSGARKLPSARQT